MFRISDHGSAKSSVRTTRHPREWLYRSTMRLRIRGADLVAVAILAIFVLVVGTGLGVAAAKVRSSDRPHNGPLRVILRGGNDVQSIQRDRVRLRRTP